jgi:hypothetical protein
LPSSPLLLLFQHWFLRRREERERETIEIGRPSETVLPK